MSVFPLQIFTADQAIAGFNDEYQSNVLNQKFAGMPRGAYVGFIPSVSTPSPILTLGVDPTEGYSLINVPSNDDHGGLTIVVKQAVTLDFTGQPVVDFPIHVLARASYTDDPDIPTTGEIFTRGAGGVATDEVLICVVDGTPTALTVDFDASAGERTEPLAFTGMDFGFMPSGSIEDLQDAVDIVNEVVAARIGLDSTVHLDLSTRLAEDQSAESMAGRLGLVFQALRSNDYSVGAGEDTVNVSGSFAEVDRDHSPQTTLDGDGAETKAGAIAGPNDASRNVCLIQDANSGSRPIDDPTDRRIVFGRVEGPETVAVAGTWTFSQAAQTVIGTGGTATSDMQVGDTIQGADGLFYEIETISGDNSIALRNAYRGSTATVDNRDVHRWILRLKKLNGAVEVDASFPVPTTIRFFFPAFLPSAESNFDYLLALHTDAEREPLTEATTTVPGLVKLADSGSLLGSVNIQNGGVPLAGGPFHALNFSAPNAVVIAAGTPGEVEVVEIGLPGATGPDGVAGATGPTGPAGPGFTQRNPYERGNEQTATGPGLPPTARSATFNMGHTVRIAVAGIAQLRNVFGGGASLGSDVGIITNILPGTPSSQEIQIDFTVGNDFGLTPFFSSAGD